MLTNPGWRWVGLLVGGVPALAGCTLTAPTLGVRYVFTRSLADDGRATSDHRASLIYTVVPRVPPRVPAESPVLAHRAVRSLPGSCRETLVCAWERVEARLATLRLAEAP